MELCFTDSVPRLFSDKLGRIPAVFSAVFQQRLTSCHFFAGKLAEVAQLIEVEKEERRRRTAKLRLKPPAEKPEKEGGHRKEA